MALVCPPLTEPVVGTAELYDPASSSWQSVPSLRTEHASHTATTLGDGRVLVFGGVNHFHAALATAEIYDPSSNSREAGPDAPQAIEDHAATAMSDGRVLISGEEMSGTCYEDTPVATCERYR